MSAGDASTLDVEAVVEAIGRRGNNRPVCQGWSAGRVGVNACWGAFRRVLFVSPGGGAGWWGNRPRRSLTYDVLNRVGVGD